MKSFSVMPTRAPARTAGRVDVRQNAVAIERAGIADRRAVRGSGSRHDAFCSRSASRAMPAPSIPPPGIAEEYRTNLQRNDVVGPTTGQRAMRCGDDDPARIVGLQHADGVGADQRRLAGNVAHDEAGSVADGRRCDGRHGGRAHVFGAVPDGLARGAAQRGGGAIDVADDAVASMWSPSPIWQVCASAVAAAMPIWSRNSIPTMPALSLPMPASFMITARTGHLAALKAL